MKNPNPAFGAQLEPFHGIPSFMRLPVSRELKGVEVAIAGIPYDSGTSFRSGARFGPRAIRQASLLLWGNKNVQSMSVILLNGIQIFYKNQSQLFCNRT